MKLFSTPYLSHGTLAEIETDDASEDRLIFHAPQHVHVPGQRITQINYGKLHAFDGEIEQEKCVG